MRLSYQYLTVPVPLWLLRWMKRRMRYVRAAGGVVSDAEGNRLLMLRNGRWDLPKGKVEAGETLLQAALREVAEETGVSPSTASPHPRCTKTYHLFNLYGGWHLKQTTWFPMVVEGVHPATSPQLDEGITATQWVTADEWHRRLAGSYGTLRTLATEWTHLHR